MKRILRAIFPALALMFMLSSCEDSRSYAELLADENKLVNSFLAQHRVEESFPADSYEVGPNAPYYKVDEEGDVYMQVLRKGNGTKPAYGDRVYFRYMRYDLNYYVVGSDENYGAGNANNIGNTEATFFLFEDYSIQQSYQFGTGIQIPVGLLGYDCQVNVIIKSQSGPSNDMSYVVPYLYTISYYPPAGYGE